MKLVFSYRLEFKVIRNVLYYLLHFQAPNSELTAERKKKGGKKTRNPVFFFSVSHTTLVPMF